MRNLIFVIFLFPLIAAGQPPASGTIRISQLRSGAGKSGAYRLQADGTVDYAVTPNPTSLSEFYGKSYEFISVSPVSATPPGGGQTYNITVTATGAWTVSGKPTWVTMTTSGTGNTVLSCTVASNNTGSSRNATMTWTLTGTSKTAQHSIFQVSL